MKPQPRSIPITEGTIGWGKGATLRATTELYLPSGFGHIKCLVDSLEVELIDLSKTSLEAHFVLHSKQSVLDNLYKEEGWKLWSLSNLLKAGNYSLNIDYKKIAPVLTLLLNSELKVDSLDLSIGGSSSIALFDQTPDFIALPNSFPPLVDNMPHKERYVYFVAKCTAIYAPVVLGKEYKLKLVFEAVNPNYQFATLFPYSKVLYRKFSCDTESEFGFHTLITKISPMRKRSLPDFLEHKLKRDHRGASDGYASTLNASAPF